VVPVAFGREEKRWCLVEKKRQKLPDVPWKGRLEG
jgi:hypothetical protein